MTKRMSGFAYVAARKTARGSIMIIPSTRTTAASAREAICTDKSKWRELRKAGYRIIRVKLSEVSPSTLAGDER